MADRNGVLTFVDDHLYGHRAVGPINAIRNPADREPFRMVTRHGDTATHGSGVRDRCITLLRGIGYDIMPLEDGRAADGDEFVATARRSA